MGFNQADMGVPFVARDNIRSSKNILLAEFIHLKAHPPFRFDCAQAKSEKLHALRSREPNKQVSALAHNPKGDIDLRVARVAA